MDGITQFYDGKEIPKSKDLERVENSLCQTFVPEEATKNTFARIRHST